MDSDMFEEWERRQFQQLSRRGFLQAVAVAGAALPVAGLIAACGGSTPSSGANDLLAKVRKAGVINIGLANDPPASIMNPDGSVSGEGPVTVQKIMAKLGVPNLHGIVATVGE